MRQFRVPQFTLTTAAVMMVVLGLAATATRADAAKNQVVKHWLKFKPGSSATLTATIAAGGFSIETEKKDALIEATDEKVTIETTISTNMAGQRRSNAPTRQTITTTSNQGEWVEVGHEKITAAGKTFDCTVVEGKSATPSRGGAATEGKAKMWVSDDVPGGVVQLQASAAGHDVTYKLTAFEVK